MTTQNFNTTRKYGVEIEFTLDSWKTTQLVNNAAALGLVINQQSYNHNTQSQWKLITDSSCGWELVSPPMTGHDGFRQIGIVCQALAMVGAVVTKSCGLHVHHDCNDLTAPQLANIFAVYAKLEKTFDSMHPQSRRNNTYCQSLTYNHYNDVNRLLAQLKTVKTVSQLDAMFQDRYRKVNFRSYLKYGTIEFRQHAGTIDAAKICNWVMMTQQVVEKAKGKVQMVYSPEHDNLQGLRNTLRLIEAKGASAEIAAMYKFMRNRVAKFAA